MKILPDNPYSIPATLEGPLRRKPRWVPCALILNAVLIAIPMLLLLAANVWIRIVSDSEGVTETGDPVSYQHFVWIEIRVWPTIAYLAIPNALLLAAHLVWYNRERQAGDEDHKDPET